MSNAGKKIGGQVERIEDPASSAAVLEFAQAKPGTSIALLATEATARGERFLWMVTDLGAVLTRRIKGKASGGGDLCLAHWLKVSPRTFLEQHRGFVHPVV